jgi:pantoate--beta-alanine ligase
VEIVATIEAARQRRQAAAAAGLTVALVPTMGSLHDGHLSLVRRARDLASRVWVSVFVNPIQFGPGEDFDSYPRDMAGDSDLLRAEGVDVVFAPTVEEMYPRPPVVELGFSGLDQVLCGAAREGHFAGVGLIVGKLFNIIRPDIAVFGQKDAQQALLIRRLVADLDFPVRIEVAPTVREPDGLAMSSRNAYLNRDQRRAAAALYRALVSGRDAIVGGERDPHRVEGLMAAVIAAEPLLELEYAVCVSQEDLSTPDTMTGPVLLALAVRAGPARLIDNLPVTPGPLSEEKC